MKRRDFIASVGVVISGAIAGCATRGAVDSEVSSASASVTEIKRHPDAIESVIEVTNDTAEGGTIGLHIHYWDGDYLTHTHYPSVYVAGGETKTITDTFQHSNTGEIDKVTAHIHDH